MATEGGMVAVDPNESEEPVRYGNLVWREDEQTFEDLDPVGTWHSELERARRRGDTAEVERRLKAGPPPGYGPDPLTFAPVVLAIEVGGDPGGAIAVGVAAKRDERLALVIVMGGPEPARFVRHLLDLAGRPDVAVVASSAPSTGDLSITDLTPPDVAIQSSDVPAAVRSITGRDPYLVVWANSGALTDLAGALRSDPALARRLQANIAAGPLDALPSHLASDPAAAVDALADICTPDVQANHPQSAVSAPLPPALLTAPTDQLDIDANSPVYERLTAPDAPAWAALLGRHLGQWFARGHASSSQYPALVVGSILGAPLTQTDVQPIRADEAGRIHVDPDGVDMEVTIGLADYFITVTDWLDNQLKEAIDGPPPG